MPEIKVAKAFTFQCEPEKIGEKDGVPIYGEAKKVYYEPGTYDVSDEVANSPYAKAFFEGYEEPGPVPGMPEYAAHAAQVAVSKERVREIQNPGSPMPAGAAAQRPAPIHESVERAAPTHHTPTTKR